MLRVTSSIPVKPPSTRLEIGQEMKLGSRSTSTTSILGSHMRMYFAAVAPPKPPPITTTRALEGVAVLAQPAARRAARAAANLEEVSPFHGLPSSGRRTMPPGCRSAHRYSPWRSGASRWRAACRRGKPASALRSARAVRRAQSDLLRDGAAFAAVADGAGRGEPGILGESARGDGEERRYSGRSFHGISRGGVRKVTSRPEKSKGRAQAALAPAFGRPTGRDRRRLFLELEHDLSPRRCRSRPCRRAAACRREARRRARGARCPG